MTANNSHQGYPRQGAIYLSRALRQLGDTKKRPVVVVSLNIRNELSGSVIVVPFTSDQTGGENSTRVLIYAGEGGLETDSIAMCDNVSAIRQIYLEQGPYGQVSDRSLQRIQTGILVAIGLYEV